MIDTVRDALQAVADGNPDGELVADEILDAASSPSSPLHPLFTWDDSVAARKYRLAQAAGLIRKYKVHIVPGKPSALLGPVALSVRPPRAYVAAPEGNPGHYVRNQHALRVMRCAHELRSLQERYSDLDEFWDAIAKLSAAAPASSLAKLLESDY